MNKQSITAVEIENKEFSTSLRGFNTTEVKSFLGLVAGEIEWLTKENRTLKDKLAETDRERIRLTAQEERVKETLLMAQQAADDARTTARREAASIIREAETERMAIVGEVERLKSERSAFVAQLRSVLEAFYQKLAPNEQAVVSVERELASG